MSSELSQNNPFDESVLLSEASRLPPDFEKSLIKERLSLPYSSQALNSISTDNNPLSSSSSASSASSTPSTPSSMITSMSARKNASMKEILTSWQEFEDYMETIASVSASANTRDIPRDMPRDMPHMPAYMMHTIDNPKSNKSNSKLYLHPSDVAQKTAEAFLINLTEPFPPLLGIKLAMVCTRTEHDGHNTVNFATLCNFLYYFGAGQQIQLDESNSSRRSSRSSSGKSNNISSSIRGPGIFTDDRLYKGLVKLSDDLLIKVEGQSEKWKWNQNQDEDQNRNQNQNQNQNPDQKDEFYDRTIHSYNSQQLYAAGRNKPWFFGYMSSVAADKAMRTSLARIEQTRVLNFLVRVTSKGNLDLHYLDYKELGSPSIKQLRIHVKFPDIQISDSSAFSSSSSSASASSSSSSPAPSSASSSSSSVLFLHPGKSPKSPGFASSDSYASSASSALSAYPHFRVFDYKKIPIRKVNTTTINAQYYIIPNQSEFIKQAQALTKPTTKSDRDVKEVKEAKKAITFFANSVTELIKLLEDKKIIRQNKITSDESFRVRDALELEFLSLEEELERQRQPSYKKQAVKLLQEKEQWRLQLQQRQQVQQVQVPQQNKKELFTAVVIVKQPTNEDFVNVLERATTGSKDYNNSNNSNNNWGPDSCQSCGMHVYGSQLCGGTKCWQLQS